jgi:hypothetical protein
MTAPSPLCTINGLPSINGVDVSGGSIPTIALASSYGVSSWSLSCIGADDLNSTAAINATISLNSSSFTASYEHPNTNGVALIFQSTINGGVDANGATQSAYTTTFGVYTTVAVATGALRVGSTNETIEGSATYGWMTKVNQAIRQIGGVLGPSAVFVANATSQPTPTPTGGGYLFATGGYPYWLGPSGPAFRIP